MSPSDGMENTDGQGEAHKTPVDKNPVDETSVDKTSVDKTSVNKLPTFDDMFEENPLALDKTFAAANTNPYDTMSYDKMHAEFQDKTRTDIGHPGWLSFLNMSSDERELALEKQCAELQDLFKTVFDKMIGDKLPVSQQSLVPFKMIAGTVPMAAEDSGPKQITRNNKPKAAASFMQLPYKIRKQIRYEALLVDEDRGKPFLTSNLARVSKEWRDDIEEVIFNDITINTLDDQEVSTFKKMFSTDRRREILTRVNIAIDDSETGPWHREGGLVEIKRIVTSIGNFLDYIDDCWYFRKDGGGYRPFEIAFTTSQFPDARMDWSRGQRLIPNTTSLWEASRLAIASGDQFDDLQTLREVKPAFPSFLEMVTYLSIPPDFVPFSVANYLMQRVPNLETLVLDPRFDVGSDDSWEWLLTIVDGLSASTPNLQNLTLRNTAYVPDRHPETCNIYRPEPMVYFAAALRFLSQGFRSLRANPFEVDEEFIRPFSPKKYHVYKNTFKWPLLQHIDLQFFEYWYDWYDDPLNPPHGEEALWDNYEAEVKQLGRGDFNGEGASISNQLLQNHEISSFLDYATDAEPILSPVDILIAAGRATAAMPVLESAHISIFSQPRGSPGIFAKRKLCPKSGTTVSSRVWLTDDFHPRARFHIMDAWADFLGPDPKVDEGLKSEFPDDQRASHPTC